MSAEGVTVYSGLLATAAFWAVLSAIFLLASPHEGDRGGGWFWGAVFVLSSLAAAWCFWRLLGAAA